MNLRLLIQWNIFILLISLLGMSCGQVSVSENRSEARDSIKPTSLSPHEDSVQKNIKSRIVHVPLGDINGDGTPDTAIIIPPGYNDPSDPQQGCVMDSCYCTIKFSNGMPELHKVIGTGESLWTVGDLDQDGDVELAMVPEWPTSVWQRMAVYGFKDKHWTCYGEVTINLNSMWGDTSAFKHRVERIDKTHFRMLEDSMDVNTDSLLLVPRIFTLK